MSECSTAVRPPLAIMAKMLEKELKNEENVQKFDQKNFGRKIQMKKKDFLKKGWRKLMNVSQRPMI